MKLPIRKQYFNDIKNDKKEIEYRDAHITFVCEETGNKITKRILQVDIIKRKMLPYHLYTSDMFDNDKVLRFILG